MILVEKEAEDADEAEVHAGSANDIEDDPRAPDARTIRILNECDASVDGDGVCGGSSEANEDYNLLLGPFCVSLLSRSMHYRLVCR